MRKTVSPEQAGISSRHVEKFLRKLEARGLCTHSVVLMRGDDIFCEAYWKPFHKDFCHRMYSQTKSYVAIAIGLLEQDGKLHLDDPIAKFFPDKIDRELPEYLAKQTVRNMLTMQTCGFPPNWFKEEDPDRTHLYLAKNSATLPAGTRWAYDSGGSQVLSSLVERLSGQSLYDFLNERIFKHLDAFQTATILKTKNDDSWGDSALLCTPRDTATFCRFLMNYGTWEGKRLLNEAYIREATSPLVSNDQMGFDAYNTGGYGYQIWTVGEDCFFFNGMCCQLAVCFPKRDLVMAITSDNDNYLPSKNLVFAALEDFILDNLQDAPLQEDPEAAESLENYIATLQLRHLSGHKEQYMESFVSRMQDKIWVCAPNQPGILWFSLHFNGDGTGQLRYENAQGKKILPFGLDKNVFTTFPQEGYSDEHGGLETKDFYYDCAVSAALREENKLQLKVQIIDRYLGNALFTLGFNGDDGVLAMYNTCENYMAEYRGTVAAKLAK